MAKSLYLHVPFCKSICYYCDFKRSLYNEEIAERWLLQIQKDLEEKKMESLDTIYIGGGTPTSLTYAQLEKLLSMLLPYAKNIKEYTIESNIESLDLDKIRLLHRYGVNRISLGIQSLQDELLKEMNRMHRKKDVFNKIDEIYTSGIKNISVDLIYGFDIQTLEMWKMDLKEVVKCKEISHISLYSLTIEENSVFGKMKRETCDNELEAEMYDYAISYLEENGFKQYEIANFARNEKESMHNKAYWIYNDFYGIGVGASGKENGNRYDHTGSILQYVEGKMQVHEEILSEEDRIFENIMMSLRMREGLDMNLFERRYGKTIQSIYKDVIDQEIQKNNLYIEDHYLKVTMQGMFYLHDILVGFMKE